MLILMGIGICFSEVHLAGILLLKRQNKQSITFKIQAMSQQLFRLAKGNGGTGMIQTQTHWDNSLQKLFTANEEYNNY